MFLQNYAPYKLSAGYTGKRQRDHLGNIVRAYQPLCTDNLTRIYSVNNKRQIKRVVLLPGNCTKPCKFRYVRPVGNFIQYGRYSDRKRKLAFLTTAHSHLTPRHQRTPTNIDISLIARNHRPSATSLPLTVCASPSFYSAKPSGARYCQGKLSVRPSERWGIVVTAWSYRLEFLEIISRLISLTFLLSIDPTWPCRRGTPPNFSRNRSGVGKIVDFRHLSRRISETVQHMVQVAIDH